MKKNILAALAAALLLAAPASALAQAGSKGTVRVGVLLPLTGNTAWAGKTNRLAAAIAVDEVNAQDLAGGYKIELVFGDSQCEPRPAHDQAQRLISQEKVQLLIGEWCSSASVAVAQVANDEKIPMLVNISTADQIASDAGPYAFQSSMQNRYAQEREATLLLKDFKFETVAIIVENNDFGLSFRKNMTALMQKAGKKIVLDVTQDRNDANWYSTITRIPNAKPDLVDRVDLGGAGGQLRQAIRREQASRRRCSPTIRRRRASSRGRSARRPARSASRARRSSSRATATRRRRRSSSAAQGPRARRTSTRTTIRRTGTSRAMTRCGSSPTP